MTAAPEHLFVYGTLRPSLRHPALRLLAEGAELLESGRMQGSLFEIAGYPGAVPSDDPADQVLGEVYRLTDPIAVLSRLDEYEEAADRFPAPREYRRERVEVTLANGETVMAWVYVYNRPTDGLIRIVGGDYLKFGEE
ncbi:MAG: gamma-glutamylcyclotransferase family protein [Syntrophotaleaceae bacterium]